MLLRYGCAGPANPTNLIRRSRLEGDVRPTGCAGAPCGRCDIEPARTGSMSHRPHKGWAGVARAKEGWRERSEGGGSPVAAVPSSIQANLSEPGEDSGRPEPLS